MDLGESLALWQCAVCPLKAARHAPRPGCVPSLNSQMKSGALPGVPCSTSSSVHAPSATMRDVVPYETANKTGSCNARHAFFNILGPDVRGCNRPAGLRLKPGRKPLDQSYNRTLSHAIGPTSTTVDPLHVKLTSDSTGMSKRLG